MHDLRAFGAHTRRTGQVPGQTWSGVPCCTADSPDPVCVPIWLHRCEQASGVGNIKHRAWLPRVRTKQQPPPAWNPQKGAGRALCACTTSRPVATSRRMYSTSETCGPKPIWAGWRATGGGLAIRAGPSQLFTLRVRRWSSRRLRAERSQRSITSNRCAGVSALCTPTHASVWAEV